MKLGTIYSLNGLNRREGHFFAKPVMFDPTNGEYVVLVYNSLLEEVGPGIVPQGSVLGPVFNSPANRPLYLMRFFKGDEVADGDIIFGDKEYGLRMCKRAEENKEHQIDKAQLIEMVEHPDYGIDDSNDEVGDPTLN